MSNASWAFKHATTTSPHHQPNIDTTTTTYHGPRMVNWKERGYVPDSDDEDESQEARGDTGGLEDQERDSNLEIDNPIDLHKPPVDNLTRDEDKTSSRPVSFLAEQDYSISDDEDDFFNFEDVDGDASTNQLQFTATEAQDNQAVQANSQMALLMSCLTSSTTTKLEAALTRGLQITQEVLGSANDSDNDTDSPLSSPPSSLQNSPGPDTAPSRQSATNPLAAGRLRTLRANQDLFSMIPGGRSFRKRAPIQLHPYALEDAKYRQSLKDRGIKPVRAPELAHNNENVSGEDSQEADAYQSSQMDKLSEHLPPSSAAPLDPDDESQPPIRGTRANALELDLGEDLPDLADILQGHATQVVRKSTESRKRLQRSKSLRINTTHNGFRVYELPGAEDRSKDLAGRSQDAFQIPPSPPLSPDATSSQGHVMMDDSERYDSDKAPFSIPTPLMSSEQRPRKRTLVGSPHSPSTKSINNGDDTASATSESSEEESQGVRRLRRRIKGVLPASWLKLDQKKQLNTEKRKGDISHSPAKAAIERGVAQHVSSNVVRSSKSDHGRLIFDDPELYASTESDSDDPVGLNYRGSPEDVAMSFMDDIVEDNAIDAMLPPISRPRSKVKKQQKLHPSWSNSGLRPVSGGGKAPIPGTRSMTGKLLLTSRKSERPRKKVKTKHTNLQMSLLNAPGFEDKEVPRFLKIAARNGKRSGHQVRQDPSKKFFRFATKQDTSDVRAGLKGWKSRCGQMHTAVAPSDQMMHGRSLTAQPRPDMVDSATSQHKNNTYLTFLKQSTDATLQVVRNHLTQNHPLHSEPLSTSQPKSTILLDYFKPSPGPRRRRFEPGTLLGLAQRTLTRNEATITPIKRLALPRRVPQRAPTRKEYPNQTQDPFISAAPRSTSLRSKSHRPRKQRPMAATERRSLEDREDDEAIQIENEYFLANGEMPDHFDREGILAHLISHVPGHQPLHKTSHLPSSHLLDGGIVWRTCTSMTNLHRLLEPTDLATNVMSPQTGHTTPLGKWTADLQDVIFELCTEMVKAISIPSTIARTHSLTINSSSDFETSYTTGQRNDVLMRCQQSLETLIECVNESLWFSSRAEVDAFLTCGLSVVERVVQELKHQYHATTSQTLELLNRVMILSYQISKVADYIGNDEFANGHILETHETVLHLAWSLALRENHTGHLFSHFANPKSVGIDSRNGSDVELVTIVLVHQLCRDDFWGTYLDKFVLERVGSIETGPGESLAYTILILTCVYCLLGVKDAHSGDDAQIGKSPDASGFIALQNTLPVFLKSFLEAKQKHEALHKFALKLQQKQREKVTLQDRRDYEKLEQRVARETQQMNKLAEFGLVAFKWCFFLIHNFGRNNADNLLKRMFKCYGDSKMRDLFSAEPSHLMPAFLYHHIPASELVMERGDKDFHIFLKLVASTLTIPQRLLEVENPSTFKKLAARKQSLVFSLLPNNAFEVKEDESLSFRDLAAVANRYNLFSTMYHYSPSGYKPPLANIKGLISFDRSHEAVCDLALQCWTSISRSAIIHGGDDSEFRELGLWIEDMFLQTVGKLQSIPDHGNRSEREQRINSANRSTASTRLDLIAERWINIIDVYATESQARHFLSGGRLTEIMNSCHANAGLPNNIIARILKLVTTYLQKSLNGSVQDSFSRGLQVVLQNIISSQCSQSQSPKEGLLTSMMESWYQVAKLMVLGKYASWETYINPASTLSLDTMSTPPATKHCSMIFLEMALSHKECFETEPFYFFEKWIESILQPESEIQFEHLFTRRLLQITPETLDLAGLVAQIEGKGTPMSHFDRNSLIEHRLDIIRHIIRNVHKMQSNRENFSTSILNETQAVRLLKIVRRTLKNTWFVLDTDSRPAWAMLINKVVFELSLYPVDGLEFEAWFTSPEILQFEDKNLEIQRVFAKVFIRGQVVDMTSDEFKEYVRTFRHAFEAAATTNTMGSLVSRIVTTFTAANQEFIDENGNYLLDLGAQLHFLKAVFPEYIARAFNDTLPAMVFALPIVMAAIELCHGVEFRFDFSDVQSMESFAELLVILMRASYRAFAEKCCDFSEAFPWQIILVARLLQLITKATATWADLCVAYPESEAILSLQTQVQTYIYYAYEYACNVSRVPCVPSDPQFWEHIPDPRGRASENFGFLIPDSDPGCTEEVQALREFAADDLEWSGRQNWQRLGLDQDRGPVWKYNVRGYEEKDVHAPGYYPEVAFWEYGRALTDMAMVMVDVGLLPPEQEAELV